MYDINDKNINIIFAKGKSVKKCAFGGARNTNSYDF